jgi:hypothetical protein
MNDFITSVYAEKLNPSNLTLTENGAITNISTGSALVDMFANHLTAIRPEVGDIQSVYEKAVKEDPIQAIKLAFYIRAISRETNFCISKLDADQVTWEKIKLLGQGLRKISFVCFAYLAHKFPDLFYDVLIYEIPQVGRWKDLTDTFLLTYLNQAKICEVIYAGLKSPETSDLVKKFLPSMEPGVSKKLDGTKKKRRKNIRHKFARVLAEFLADKGMIDGDRQGLKKAYRLFKKSGKAHLWQQAITNRNYGAIDWQQIPGRALSQLTKVTSDGLTWIDHHGLADSYLTWLLGKTSVNFNGYPFELFEKLPQAYYGYGRQITSSPIVYETINRQWESLLQNSAPLAGNVWVAVDTSGSMNMPVAGTKSNAQKVCLSIGFYIAQKNTGAFKDKLVLFDSTCKLATLEGDNLYDRYRNFHSKYDTAWGSTNFESVIQLLVETRASHPEIAIEDFPKTVVVITDMQFDPIKDRSSGDMRPISRVLQARLTAVGLGDTQFIYWNLSQNRNRDSIATKDQGNVAIFSGFDPAIIEILLGKKIDLPEDSNAEPAAPREELTPEKAFLQAMDQEILNRIALKCASYVSS